MSMILAIAIVLFLIFVPTIITALFEKRMVWPYSPLRKTEIEPEKMSGCDDKKINDYIIQFINGAIAEGFEYLGFCNDAKGDKYKILYHFLISPDKYALGVIGGGKILGMRVWGTWIFSRSYDEACYYSVDNQSGVEKDMSNLCHDQLVFCKDFVTLYEKHKEWIQKSAVAIKKYSDGNELNDLRNAKRYWIDYMERLGYVRNINSNKEYWKYTLRGAIKLSFFSIVTGLFRHIKGGKIHAR